MGVASVLRVFGGEIHHHCWGEYKHLSENDLSLYPEFQSVAPQSPSTVSSPLHCFPDKVSVPPVSLLASALHHCPSLPPFLHPSPPLPQPPGEERYCWCITTQDNLFKWQIRRVTRFVSDTVCSVCYQSNKAAPPPPHPPPATSSTHFASSSQPLPSRHTLPPCLYLPQ